MIKHGEHFINVREAFVLPRAVVKNLLESYITGTVFPKSLQFSHIYASFGIHLDGGTIQQPFKSCLGSLGQGQNRIQWEEKSKQILDLDFNVLFFIVNNGIYI